MAQTFEDRVEEVLGVLQEMAWPLLEEPQKRKIVGIVAKGIDKGDTLVAWSHALGVPVRTIGQRVQRFRSSEPVDGAASAPWTQDPSRIRAAKNVMRDPAAAAAVIGKLTPTEREQVFAAAGKTLQPSGDTPRVTMPELDPWSEVVNGMFALERQTKKLADRIEATRMTEHREAEIDEWIDGYLKLVRSLRTKEGRADLRLVVGGES